MPLIFQGYLPNFSILLVFYIVFYCVQKQQKNDGMASIQMIHFSIQTSLLSILAAWVLGFVGLFWSLIFFVPAMIVSAGYAMGRSNSSEGSCLMIVMITIVIFVIIGSFMGGLDMRDWYTFQHDCPRVSVNELPMRTEDAFVVSDGLVKFELTGHHTWTSTDKEGNTTTHRASYAPIVDANWTEAKPISAWVDVEHQSEWVGRIVRDSASEKEWVAVQNAKLLHSVRGVGEGEDTFRIVDSDESLIEGIQFSQYFQLPFVILEALMGLVLLVWFRKSGRTSAT